jgi:predicted dehydrogenase
VGRRGQNWIGAVETHTAHDEAIAHHGLHHGASYVEHLRFAAAIRSGEPPEVTLEDGYWAVAMGAAAHRSIETGRPVMLADIMRRPAGDGAPP